MNVAMGDLVDLVGAQAQGYASKTGRRGTLGS
jgi:hypothetical protein